MVAGDGLCVPCDILNAFPQEVVLAASPPQIVQFLGGEAASFENIAGCLAGSALPGLLVDWIIQPAAQGAAGFGVELAQQTAAPGIPQGWIGAVDISHSQGKQVIQMFLIANVRRRTAG